MSVALSNVRRTDGPRNAEITPGSFLVEELAHVRDLVAREAPDATPLLDALDETIDGHDICKTRDDHSRRLIVAKGAARNSGIEGLTYIEGSEPERNTFGEASISTWVSPSRRLIPRADHLFNHAMSEQRRVDIREHFYRIGLGNWDMLHKELGVSADTVFWGLPVCSTTRVTPVGNQEGDIQVPFYCGEWRDVFAVSGLQVPDALKGLVMDAVMGHHATKRLAETLAEQKLQAPA